MRVGLITTLNTNLGDDFIREGICQVLREVFEGRSIEFIAIDKQYPLTVYPPRHPIRVVQNLARSLPRGKGMAATLCEKLCHPFGFSRFDGCDLIVQCGTPVAWPGCSKTPWGDPLWHRVVGRLSRKGTIVLNLGAGSCYPWESHGDVFKQRRDALYLRRILGYCRRTTVRDRLAQSIFRRLGEDCPLIPCPAFLAGKRFADRQAHRELIVINYMKGGGHYDWGQSIDPSRWENVMREVIRLLRKDHPVVFLCHDQTEYHLASALDDTVPRFTPADLREYFTLMSRAKVGVCNRLHAAVALAGIGIPSVSVGTDTRLLMVEAVGMPSFYVKEATSERLGDTVHRLLTDAEDLRERLLALREETWERYVHTVAEVT